MSTYPIKVSKREYARPLAVISRIDAGLDCGLERIGTPRAEFPFDGEWDFLCRAVYTEDQARGEIRPFPAYDYLRYIVEARREHQIFVVEKSRRMYATWLFCALYLYDTLTQPHHANFIASRKLESSCELLGRCHQIYESIPASVWPDKPVIVTHAGHSGKGFRRLECGTSFLEAVAEGKDQLRQYTATNILLDEFAFWQRAEESWSALKPTIEGGGHIDIISTPELGAYMYRLVYQ